MGGHRGRSREWLSLLLLCSVQFMVVLDVTVVNVALPTIGEDVGIPEDSLHWLISAYALAFGGFLLVGGRAGDVLGRRRVFLAGAALFGLSSLVCGLAGSGEVLIAGRVGQGLGSALLSPSAFAILTATFAEGAERNRVLGVWASTTGLAAAAGALLGGVLTELLGWQAIFLVNVPVAIAALVAAPALLRESRGAGSKRLDVVGATLVTAAACLVVLTLAQAPRAGWLAWQTMVALAASALLLALFARRERRSSEPLLPRTTLRSARRRAAALAGFCHGAMMLSTFLLLTFAFQQLLGFSALEAGLGLLALRGTSILWAQAGVRLANRLRPGALLGLGLVIVCVALVTFTGASPGGSYATDFLPGLLLLGAAIPFVFLALSILATSGVRADEAGLASGILNTCQWIGGALGVALASTAIGIQGEGELLTDAGAIGHGFWLPAGMAAAGLLAAATVLRRA